jgi:hypothetical protein
MTIRHDCETQGCYVKEQTPDWGFTDNAFSGKIRVTDIDGAVEANGHLLLLEWKGRGASIPKGQSIMFEKITRINHIVVFVINGDAKYSSCSHLSIYENGKITQDLDVNNEDLCEWCKKWENYARGATL